MTLKDLQFKISQMAIQDALINASFSTYSIEAVNSETIREYPILITMPTGSHSVAENYTTYTLTLYYLDRLLNDNSNQNDVMSQSVEVLKNMANKIANMNGIVRMDRNYEIVNFVDTEALSDRVAGAYATLKITIKNDTVCGL